MVQRKEPGFHFSRIPDFQRLSQIDDMLASTLGCQETITVKGTTRKKPPTETPETSTFQKGGGNLTLIFQFPKKFGSPGV